MSVVLTDEQALKIQRALDGYESRVPGTAAFLLGDIRLFGKASEPEPEVVLDDEDMEEFLYDFDQEFAKTDGNWDFDDLITTNYAPSVPLMLPAEEPPKPAKWEEVTVDPKGAGHTYKLAVEGGHLYRTVTYRFPEAHAQMEAGYLDLLEEGVDLSEDEKIEMLKDGQEIVAQTVVFVPAA